MHVYLYTVDWSTVLTTIPVSGMQTEQHKQVINKLDIGLTH